jgi:hypothetical protein
MRDLDGNIMEIEVRGERHQRKCFFRLNDISKIFGHKTAAGSQMYRDTRSFNACEDYCKFMVTEKNLQEIFLTYCGLLRFIFTSRTSNARKYVEWAMEILFTAQMGTEEQREQLAANTTGIPVDIVRQFSGKVYIGGMPGIYLFRIGSVGELKDPWNLPSDLPDNYVICKYGRTNTLYRRSGEHRREFKKLCGKRKKNKEETVAIDDTDNLIKDLEELSMSKGVKCISLLYYAHIDPRYTVEAERRIKAALKDKRINFQNKKELVALSEVELYKTELLFVDIRREFAGGLQEIEEELRSEKEKRIRFESLYELSRDAVEEQKKQNEVIRSLASKLV